MAKARLRCGVSRIPWFVPLTLQGVIDFVAGRPKHCGHQNSLKLAAMREPENNQEQAKGRHKESRQAGTGQREKPGGEKSGTELGIGARRTGVKDGQTKPWVRARKIR